MKPPALAEVLLRRVTEPIAMAPLRAVQAILARAGADRTGSVQGAQDRAGLARGTAVPAGMDGMGLAEGAPVRVALAP